MKEEPEANPRRFYTCRENVLLKAIDDACQDFTEGEILKVIGRKLHMMSYDPIHQVPAHSHFRALAEGHQMARWYFMVDCPAPQAMALVSGMIAGMVAHYTQTWPRLPR